MTRFVTLDRDRVVRWQWRALLIGGAALAASVVGGWFAPRHFFQAYLVNFLFLLGISLGGMALLMVHYLTSGAWGLLVRRTLEAQMKTLPLIALLFLPIALGLAQLYPWAEPPISVGTGLARFKGVYLLPSFFWCRAAAYFACWFLLALLLGRWSKRQDETGNVRLAWMCMNVSGPGLVAYGVSLHFAAIDWLMSVETGFTSTIFGPLVAAGQLLSALAWCLVVFAWLVVPAIRDTEEFSIKAVNDLGGLLFTLLIVWAYMVWFQFMLVWMANLPAGGGWYVARGHGGWPVFALLLFGFHFVIPFFLLLLRAVKQRPPLLAAVAGLMLLTQLAYMHYQVLPAFEPPPPAAYLLDVGLALGLNGIWLACFLWLLRRAPLLPRRDFNQAHAARLRQLDQEEARREELLLPGGANPGQPT